MIYKLKSAKSVISKIYRDYKPTTVGWESSAIEWIGEAVEAIGCSAGLYLKSTANEGCDGAITISNFRAKLPCDLVNLQAVEYKGQRLPYGSDLTGGGLPLASRTTDIYTNNSTVEVIAGLSKPVEEINNTTYTSTSIEGEYYIINPSYIQTSFESGHIKLHYEAYPIDSEGYPMIPDHYYYDTAISWYVINKLILSGGYSNPNIDFNMSYNMWVEYKRLAQNKAAFPSIDKMDRFKSMWVRLIPNTTAPDSFFAGGEQQEGIKYV